MDVFLISVGRDRYELYCESSTDAEGTVESLPPSGVFGRLRERFTTVLRAAEERQHRHDDTDDPRRGWLGRLQDRALGWVAQRIAEQRLLWNLRRETAAVAAHPDDMPFEQVMTVIRSILQRDFERHRLWLVIDVVGLIASAPLAVVPGPNMLAYYFAFRVFGHWLSMRGATQGLHRVAWSGRPCPPLVELRDAVMLETPARDARIHDIAARLRLRHLTTFVERVVMRHA